MTKSAKNSRLVDLFIDKTWQVNYNQAYSMNSGVVMPNFNPERFKEIRIVRKLTLDQLAASLGVTKQAISKYEHGKSIPSSETISKMLSIMDASRQYFTKKSAVLGKNSSALSLERPALQVKPKKTLRTS